MKNYLRALLKTTSSFKNHIPLIPSNLQTFRREFSTAPTQGITGQAALITGDFKQFTKADKHLMQLALIQSQQLFVVVNDRNTIQIPANERAHWIRKEFKNDPRLQVMVLYGASELNNDESLRSYSKLIQTKLPKAITFSKVLCQHHYSPLLAQLLGVAHKQVAVQAESVPIVKGDKQSRFSQRMTFYPDESSRSIEIVRAEIDWANTFNHPNKSLFFKRIRFDLNALSKPNLPIAIGRIVGAPAQIEFSSVDNAQVYDMPIYVPGQGWRVPMELKPYCAVLKRIVAAELTTNPNIDNCYAYVTIDSGIVAPNHYARRGGLHVDGFVSNVNQAIESDGVVYGDNTYIVCDDLGTEFYKGPFDLSKVNHDDPVAVLKAFDEQGKGMPFVQAEPYTIYRLTVNNVHAVHPNDTGEYRQRTFLKCTFSVRPFNRLGSTINPLFNGLKWNYVPRDLSSRNTQNYAGACPEGYLDSTLALVQFNQKTGPAWCGSFFYARKKLDQTIKAVPATPGAQLKTVVNSDVITTNFAGEDDMEVTRIGGDRYFLPQRKFHDLYKLVTEDNVYSPRPRVLAATRISQPVSVIGLWGTRQNLPKDSVIVSNGQEAWGVHPESFEATYEPCAQQSLRSTWYD